MGQSSVDNTGEQRHSVFYEILFFGCRFVSVNGSRVAVILFVLGQVGVLCVGWLSV